MSEDKTIKEVIREMAYAVTRGRPYHLSNDTTAPVYARLTEVEKNEIEHRAELERLTKIKDAQEAEIERMANELYLEMSKNDGWKDYGLAAVILMASIAIAVSIVLNLMKVLI